MQPFQPGFTAPTWQHVLVLIVGAILAPGRRTVAAALRVIGLDQEPHFTNYHRVLNRNQWSSRWLARCLLRLLIATFVPTGPVIVGLDDTIERRWGAKIKARGIYRDPVRSSRSHVVKASGLRWLSLMLLPQIPWAGRVWALPFLTVLAPSERYARERQQQYKKLTDWGRQMLLQLVRWLPERRIIAVTDASFAAIELLNALRCWLCMITRLRLDARLFDPPPRRRAGTMAGLARSASASQPSPSASSIVKRAGGGSRSPAGMAAANAWSRSYPAPPSGIIPAASSRSAMCWSATSPVNSSHRPSRAPISMPIRSTFCAGLSAGGQSRSRLPRSAATSA
jgi:DDE superfamily endonuclease